MVHFSMVLSSKYSDATEHRWQLAFRNSSCSEFIHLGTNTMNNSAFHVKTCCSCYRATILITVSFPFRFVSFRFVSFRSFRFRFNFVSFSFRSCRFRFVFVAFRFVFVSFRSVSCRFSAGLGDG